MVQKNIPRGNSHDLNASTMATSDVVMVPLANLRAWSGNPRQHFDEEGLAELASSIRSLGLLQPLTVRPTLCHESVEEGLCYDVIAGGRRLRACRIAGLDPVPCLVRDVTEAEALMVAITENDQRKDVNPMERARSYARLIELSKLPQTEIARRLNRSQSWLSSYVSLVSLPDGVQALVASEKKNNSYRR